MGQQFRGDDGDGDVHGDGGDHGDGGHGDDAHGGDVHYYNGDVSLFNSLKLINGE